MAEEIIEFNGAGFIPGVPGMFANCQVRFDSDTKEVLGILPLGAGPASVTTSQGPVTISVYGVPAEPVISAQPVEQSSVEENQGG